MNDTPTLAKVRRVAAVQMDLTPEAAEDRLGRMDALLDSPAARGASLVVFPEMSVPGYDLSAAGASHAERLDGPSVSALRRMALRHDAILVAGLTEVRGSRRFNTAVVIGPDGLCGAYRKRHVSSVENAIWHRGGAQSVVETDIGRIGLGICADMLFSTPWLGFGSGGVDLIVCASAWPDFRGAAGVPMRAATRAYHHRFPIEFVHRLSASAGVPVILANASGPFSVELPVFGRRLSLRAAGHSRVAVDGRTIADDSGDASEQVVSAEVRLGQSSPPTRRERAGPDLGDRLLRAELLAGEVTSAWLFRCMRTMGLGRGQVEPQA